MLCAATSLALRAGKAGLQIKLEITKIKNKNTKKQDYKIK